MNVFLLNILSLICNIIVSWYVKFCSANKVNQLLLLLSFIRQVITDSLWSHGLQHTRHPCPSPSPKVCPSSGPLHPWCHRTISFCWPLLFLNKQSVLEQKSVSRTISSVQLLSCVWIFATLGTTACQSSLSITNSRNTLKLTSIESVMPSNHLILCHPLLLLSSIFPSIRVFSNESTVRIRWPKCWNFNFSISLSNEYTYICIPSLWGLPPPSYPSRSPQSTELNSMYYTAAFY